MASTETDYSRAIEWLYSQLPMFSRTGAAAYKPGLDNTLALDAIFGHPHKAFKSIHIAGTNGKGSVSNMLSAILQAQGYKVGLYTSPHLLDFRERIRVNGKMIPEKRVTEFVNDWKAMESELKPSFFELTMMLAFKWFEEEKVDFAVIETGMGGRLDSTNVITPILSVITNISLDHTQFLGTTHEAIAAEKAGIIKENVPVVVGQAQGEVKHVFMSKAIHVSAPIFFADKKGAAVSFVSKGTLGWDFTRKNGQGLFVPLAGNYQPKNIRTVITAVDVLIGNCGVEISNTAVIAGLDLVKELTGFRGRWEIIGKNPVVICDIGHNVGGLKENLLTLRKEHPLKKVIFVLGFVADKDVERIVRLFPVDARYVFTQPSLPRAMEAEKVAHTFKGAGISGHIVKEANAALEHALSIAEEGDVVYVGGSTFVVADVLAKR